MYVLFIILYFLSVVNIFCYVITKKEKPRINISSAREEFSSAGAGWVYANCPTIWLVRTIIISQKNKKSTGILTKKAENEIILGAENRYSLSCGSVKADCPIML